MKLKGWYAITEQRVLAIFFLQNAEGQTSKRATKSMLSPPSIDTCNFRTVAGAFPTSWVRIGYATERGEGLIGGEGGDRWESGVMEWRIDHRYFHSLDETEQRKYFRARVEPRALGRGNPHRPSGVGDAGPTAARPERRPTLRHLADVCYNTVGTGGKGECLNERRSRRRKLVLSKKTSVILLQLAPALRSGGDAGLPPHDSY
ncbi:hypothetical protein EVAR_74546_1 [Eumeta japonica]|uniref:Uncharacterized protein n=1 Tax=Eumeta variegata TaxID=151549 RepID=A0A4C1TET1_EUMVA|nr:hypothetical protein EVAR_74546_1 [Eumeta japonica]